MKKMMFFAGAVGALGLLSGCETIPPGAERGPNGTIAYEVSVESSPPGATIEANGQKVGETPLKLKIFGDTDGTFHDFGSYYYIVRALPMDTNQFTQTRVFRTGHLFTPEDHIPQQIFFDMSKKPDEYPPPTAYGAPPPYPYPYPYYYGPYYYGPRIYIGPGYYHRHGW